MFATAAVQISASRRRYKNTRFNLHVNFCLGNFGTLAAAGKGRRPLSDSVLCSAHVFLSRTRVNTKQLHHLKTESSVFMVELSGMGVGTDWWLFGTSEKPV